MSTYPHPDKWQPGNAWARRVLQEIRDRGVSVFDLATDLGITPGALFQQLANEKPPRLQSRLAYKALLDVEA